MMKMVVLLLALFTAIQSSLGGANQPQNNKRQRKSTAASRFGSSVVFPVTGDVYPNGYYHATINVGHPPNPYFLDIDSGSDLTWLQCDAPCTKCTPVIMVSIVLIVVVIKAPHSPYKPSKDLVRCKDPLCASLDGLVNKPCDNPDEQCDYEVEYADHGSSMGVLVRDSFPLSCGYNQEVPSSVHPPYTDGVLGLADGKSSIVSQLKHYKVGPAELLYGKQATGAKGFLVIFDSGSTYSYFNSDAYKATLSIMKKDLRGKKLEDAADDQSLPICWKGTKPFKSISDVKNYFKPLEHGNVCLGILNGTAVGLGNFNVLGDISLQDKMVIYDNEKQQIGWVTANCDRIPKC
ncbi:hypothetical protein C3L33_21614, partial [Rhododendron williamsianum]